VASNVYSDGSAAIANAGQYNYLQQGNFIHR